MSEQSNTQYGLTVKEATSRVYPFIEGMNLVMKILDQLNMKGVSTVEDLEAILSEVNALTLEGTPLMREMLKWCKDEDIDTAEDFTSKIEEMGNELDEYRSNVQSELNEIASAIDTIEGL
jgi:RNA processing factor Prp31